MFKMSSSNSPYKEPAWIARRTRPRWLRFINGGVQWHIVATLFMAFFPIDWTVILGLALSMTAALAMLSKRSRVEGVGFIVLGPASTIALNLLLGMPTREWPVWLPCWACGP